MKVYLSPSDQWSNIATGSGHSEAHHCKLICQSANKYLLANGVECIVGNNDSESTYINRVEESNNWNADLHVPVHTNAGGGRGTLVLVYDTESAKNKYVQGIYNEVSKLTPSADNGIRISPDLYEINSTVAMCCYLEVDFHDNSEIEKWIDKNIDNIGKAIAKGIVEATGKTFKTGTEEQVTPEEYLYKVQVGAFKSLENAQKLSKELNSKGYNTLIKREKK